MAIFPARATSRIAPHDLPDVTSSQEAPLVTQVTNLLAGPCDISFVNSRKAAQQAADCKAGCLIVPMDFPGEGRTVIRARVSAA